MPPPPPSAPISGGAPTPCNHRQGVSLGLWLFMINGLKIPAYTVHIVTHMSVEWILKKKTGQVVRIRFGIFVVEIGLIIIYLIGDIVPVLKNKWSCLQLWSFMTGSLEAEIYWFRLFLESASVTHNTFTKRCFDRGFLYLCWWLDFEQLAERKIILDLLCTLCDRPSHMRHQGSEASENPEQK